MAAPLRRVQRVSTAHRQLEGGGFPVRRPFPSQDVEQADPFLLLDEMGPVSWGPREAIGAPDHPHRGFETVTYLLEGRMEHKDSQGHKGMLGPGDVQWMTAGAGVIHSEKPEQRFYEEGGTSHGFQLWVNLPAKDKLTKPRYQEIPKDRIPAATSEDGKVRVKVIAGHALGTAAAIETRTPIQYLHFQLSKGGLHEQAIPDDQRAYVYVFGGRALVGEDETPVEAGQLAALEGAGAVRIAHAGDDDDAELLVLSGVPLHEPVAWYGPFVMNTEDEIRQAIRDFQSGKLGSIPADL